MRVAVFFGALVYLGSVHDVISAPSSLDGWFDHGLDKENMIIVADDLTRVQDVAALKRLIKQGHVVRVPDRGSGFVLDSRIGTCDRLSRRFYRYARPYTVRFLTRFASQYRAKFHDSFVVTSLIRTCDYQNRLRRSNSNAATCEETSHTAGSTVDLNKNTMTPKGREWARQVFLDLERRGLIQATEERGQPVFHIMVRRAYAKYNPAGGAKPTRSKLR